MELGHAPSKRRSAAVATGSTGRVEPASAPAPSGRKRGPTIPVGAIDRCRASADARAPAADAEGHRLRMLQMRETWRRRSDMIRGLSDERLPAAPTTCKAICRSGRAGKAEGQSRPGRYGCDPHAACPLAHPSARTSRARAPYAHFVHRPTDETHRGVRRRQERPASLHTFVGSSSSRRFARCSTRREPWRQTSRTARGASRTGR